MPTGQGMQKDQWEQRMFEFFLRLLKGSMFNGRFDKPGLIIRYLSENVNVAEWETVALNQRFDHNKRVFFSDGEEPPGDPMARRAWEAKRRQQRIEAEQRIRSRTGKKCPVCGSWNTDRVKPEDHPTNILLPFGAFKDQLLCLNPACGARTMWDSQELEVDHDTEVIVKCDILSSPFRHPNGKLMQLRHPALDIWKVNGTHEVWNDEEVRRMMMSMWIGEKEFMGTKDNWFHESVASFEAALKEIADGS